MCSTPMWHTALFYYIVCAHDPSTLLHNIIQYKIFYLKRVRRGPAARDDISQMATGDSAPSAAWHSCYLLYNIVIDEKEKAWREPLRCQYNRTTHRQDRIVEFFSVANYYYIFYFTPPPAAFALHNTRIK